MISSVLFPAVRSFQMPVTASRRAVICSTVRGGAGSWSSTARVRMSRTSASIDRPRLAAWIRSLCFTDSASPRMVKVVVITARYDPLSLLSMPALLSMPSGGDDQSHAQPITGVRWQSAAATPLWLNPETPEIHRVAAKNHPPANQPSVHPGRLPVNGSPCSLIVSSGFLAAGGIPAHGWRAARCGWRSRREAARRGPRPRR